MKNKRVEILVISVLLLLCVIQKTVAWDAKYIESILGPNLETNWGNVNTAVQVDVSGEEENFLGWDLLDLLRQENVSSSCRDEIDKVIAGRNALQLWALRMTYSSVSLPKALLDGRIYHLGDFDACLDVDGDTQTGDRGRFCLVDVAVRPGDLLEPQEELSKTSERASFQILNGDQATIWDLLQVSGNRRRYRRDIQQWGICIPAACVSNNSSDSSDSVSNLAEVLTTALEARVATLGLNVTVALDSDNCQKASASFLSRFFHNFCNPGAAIIFVILALLVVITVIGSGRTCILSTIPIGEGAMSGPVGRFLECWSVQDNWNRLMNSHQAGQIRCVHGLRTITTILVILGHRVWETAAGPLHNPTFIENTYTDVLMMYVINGHLIVTTFLVMSGFLVAESTLRHLELRGSISVKKIVTMYLTRYIRMVLPMAVVLGITAFWTDPLGTGPLWPQIARRVSSDCRSYWWTNLLMINNYVHSDSTCMPHTWYLAVDMQQYLLAPWLILCIWRWPRASCKLLGLMLLVASVITYVPVVLADLNPTPFFLPQQLRRWWILGDRTMKFLYFPSYTNLGPFIIGLGAGVLDWRLKRAQWKPSLLGHLAFWLVPPAGFVLQTLVVWLVILFFQPGYTSRPYLDAFYAPIRLLGVALPTAAMIIACNVGGAGMWNNILSWTPLMVLSRLSFCTYLVHMTLIHVTAGIMRAPSLITEYTVISGTAADVCLSLALALPLHFCVEAPIRNLLRHAHAPPVSDTNGVQTGQKGGPTPAVSKATLTSRL